MCMAASESANGFSNLQNAGHNMHEFMRGVSACICAQRACPTTFFCFTILSFAWVQFIHVHRLPDWPYAHLPQGWQTTPQIKRFPPLISPNPQISQLQDQLVAPEDPQSLWLRPRTMQPRRQSPGQQLLIGEVPTR